MKSTVEVRQSGGCGSMRKLRSSSMARAMACLPLITADLEFFLDQPRPWPKRAPKRLRRGRRPPLTIRQVLAWAEAHFERTGNWPAWRPDPVFEAAGENWRALDLALKRGSRGLPGGTSLAQLLANHFGKRNIAKLPKLSVRRILCWADTHHART